MKKLAAFMLTILMLACALPALAEDAPLHTFAGIPWDTPKDEFITIATDQVGVAFDDYPADVYREYNPTFVVQDGYYSVLGLPLAAQQGLYAHYARTEALLGGEVEWTDPAAWCFDRFSCVGAEQPLTVNTSSLQSLKNDLMMYENDLRLAQNVANTFMDRYGTPEKGYVALNDRGCYDYYLVPEVELPYVIEDAALFAVMNDISSFKVVLASGNVLYTLEASYANDRDSSHEGGSYTISLDYLNRPVVSSDFSNLFDGDLYEADLAAPFPLLKGEIPYIVIEP